MTSNLEKEKIEFMEGDDKGGAKERSSRSLFVELALFVLDWGLAVLLA